MKSQITSDFVDLFRALPEHVRETARKNYRLWVGNHAHPSLQFKKVHSVEPLLFRSSRDWVPGDWTG